jgi:hypothetical protein
MALVRMDKLVKKLMSNPADLYNLECTTGHIQGYTGQYLINNLPSGILLYIQGYTGQYLINNLPSGVLLYIQGYTGQQGSTLTF